MDMSANDIVPQGAASPKERLLWDEFVAHRDPLLRQALLERYLPFARILAGKLYADRWIREVEFDEYLHYAVLGLIEAVDRFEPARAVAFRTYAGYRIRGTVLNHVSHLSERHEQISWRARLRKERAASVTGTLPRHRRPKDLFAEMAGVAVGLALGVLLEHTGMLAQRGACCCEDPARCCEDPARRSEDPYARHELRQTQKTMRAIVELLPDQERRVVKYHYYFGLTLEQVSALLEVSRSRVSQVHRQALGALRHLYADAARLNLQL